MRILLDYRPALRERSGVGEYVHGLARALASTQHDDEIAILTLSWKDRLDANALAELDGVRVIDRRLPVRPVTWAWNRLGWPPVEWLARRPDVVHAQTPLLIPSMRAAQIITIHDLHFLKHPDRTEAEMRRDYPALVHAHARRADHVVVSSRYAAAEVSAQLGVPRDRVTVCSPGPPGWAANIARQRPAQPAGSILFLGTINPRKNVSTLLAAYAQLRSRRPDAPPLILAGRVSRLSTSDLDPIRRPGVAQHVTLLGYVTNEERQRLLYDAAMLVLPSLEEGFGLPVLEAMACGVPVVVSDRGSLPEIAGDAARPVRPEDIDGFTTEMARLLDPAESADAVARGLRRAREYSWAAAAEAARGAYASAMAARAERGT